MISKERFLELARQAGHLDPRACGDCEDFAYFDLGKLNGLLEAESASSDQPDVNSMLQMIHAGAIGPCRGIDLQYRSKGSCGWPDTWRVTFIKPDVLGSTPTVVFAGSPHDALRLLMQTCGYQFESRNLDLESLVEGRFYMVTVINPDAEEPWEREPMPARYVGDGKWNYLDAEPSDWPVAFVRGLIP